MFRRKVAIFLGSSKYKHHHHHYDRLLAHNMLQTSTNSKTRRAAQPGTRCTYSCTYKTQFPKTVIGLRRVPVSKRFSSLLQDINKIHKKA